MFMRVAIIASPISSHFKNLHLSYVSKVSRNLLISQMHHLLLRLFRKRLMKTQRWEFCNGWQHWKNWQRVELRRAISLKTKSASTAVPWILIVLHSLTDCLPPWNIQPSDWLDCVFSRDAMNKDPHHNFKGKISRWRLGIDDITSSSSHFSLRFGPKTPVVASLLVTACRWVEMRNA